MESYIIQDVTLRKTENECTVFPYAEVDGQVSAKDIKPLCIVHNTHVIYGTKHRSLNSCTFLGNLIYGKIVLFQIQISLTRILSQAVQIYCCSRQDHTYYIQYILYVSIKNTTDRWYLNKTMVRSSLMPIYFVSNYFQLWKHKKFKPKAFMNIWTMKWYLCTWNDTVT